MYVGLISSLTLKSFLIIYFCNKCFLRFGIFSCRVLIILHISFIISHGNSKLKEEKRVKIKLVNELTFVECSLGLRGF